MLVSLKDKAKGTFSAPILVESEEEAKRQLTMCFMSGEKSMLTQFPTQFELYSVGDFDVQSGIMNPINPQFIINGLTAKMNAIDVIQKSQVDVVDSFASSPSGNDEKIKEVISMCNERN